MASRVDHEQRRRELTDALGRITLKGGLAGVSYREVANEAGVSVATVQYYFGTKDELLLAAWEHLASRVTRRIFAALADAGTAPSPQATIATALEAFLPLDAERTDAATLFIAFHTASLTDPLLARAEARAMPRDLVTFIADELGRARRERFLASWVDPEIEARLIVTQIIGLAHMMLSGTYAREDGIKAAAYSVSRLFTRPR